MLSTAEEASESAASSRSAAWDTPASVSLSSSPWALSTEAASWTEAALSPVPSSITPSAREAASSRQTAPISAGMCQLRLGQPWREWTTGLLGRRKRNIMVKDPFPYTGKEPPFPFFYLIDIE